MNTSRHASVAAAFAAALGFAAICPADEPPLEATISVNAAETLHRIDPQRLGGTNVAMWIDAQTFASPEVRKWMAELRAGLIRLPGGSWSNGIYWNGHGVRGPDRKVDPTKVGPDGYPAVDYSGYSPSFRVDEKTLHPHGGDWHGNVDVKALHEFIKAIPGTSPMPCPNAGTGRAIDAAEWVKWSNLQMGFDARYWEIGNELGGSWEAGTQLPFGKGQLTGEMYAKRFNDFADAMRAVDPGIRIGGGAFAEEMIRDCGRNVDFVSIHTYPGSVTMSDAEMFALIRPTVGREVGQVRKWIRQYQPDREEEIEIAYTEWNVGGGISGATLFSGLWCSIVLGEMASNGVDIATQWDAFTGPDLLFREQDRSSYTRMAEYYALWFWNNYMGDRLIPATGGGDVVYSYATRSDEAVCLMLVNTDREREARVNVSLRGMTPAPRGEMAVLSSREYYWNPITRRPQWSTGPRIEEIGTGKEFGVTLAPFSLAYVRIPDERTPELSSMARKALAEQRPAQGKPELRFVMPGEMYAGDELRGELIALSAGTERPYGRMDTPAAVSVRGGASLDRSEVRLAESVGHFTLKADEPGELTLTARAGDVSATHKILVKASTPRPMVFWDFARPPVTDAESFSSDFKLSEDLTQRANRAVARVDLADVTSSEKSRTLLAVRHLPEADKLKKENIRGVVFDMLVSPDFTCDDPNVRVKVVMQSPANWWMDLGDIPLKDLTTWKTQQLDVTQEKHIKAMPTAFNILFLLNAGKPVTGSIYFDRIGLMVR